MSLPDFTELMHLCDTNEAFYFADHQFDGNTYRIFNYRMASYGDFLLPSALECRGHTYIQHATGVWFLVSLPMQKFFNDGENPFTMDLDWSQVEEVADKLDGSLISTVLTPRGFTLKSKGSLNSDQSNAANKLLDTEQYWEFRKLLQGYVDMGCTVNMEYTAPDNQIVLSYSQPALKVLNIRRHSDGAYLSLHDSGFYLDQIAAPLKVDDMAAFVKSVEGMVGVEGFVFTFKDGLKVKKKTAWYSALHLQKEQVTNPRRLFEAVIMEQSDDLKALFLADPESVKRIEDMEDKGRALYNHLAALVRNFYEANKGLDRKDFAVKGQAELSKDKVFSLAMNLYTGRDMGLKEHLIKNYKLYGITDTSVPLNND